MLKTLHFSELNIRVLTLALKRSDERVLARTVCDWTPWWALGLVKRTYFILATDRRAVLVEYGFNFFFGFVVKAVHSLPWSSVTEARTKGIFFKKKLVIAGQGEQVVVDGEMLSGGGLFSRTMIVDRGLFGLFTPVTKNYDNARALVDTFNALRSDPSGQAAQLPMGAPQMMHAPQAAATFGYGAQPYGTAHPSAPPPAQSPSGAPPHTLGYPQQAAYPQQATYPQQGAYPQQPTYPQPSASSGYPVAPQGWTGPTA